MSIINGSWNPAWRYSRGISKPRHKPASLFVIHFGAFTSYKALVNYFKYNPDKRYADSTWCVGQDGEWTQMVRTEDTPWTNGSWLGKWTDENGKLTPYINSIALTVETSNNVVNNYFVYTEEQYKILAWMFKWTLSNFEHTKAWRICGHEHMVPNYKVDPGPLFDWEMFLVHHVGIKQSFYNSHMRFLSDASNIKKEVWWKGIDSKQAKIKRETFFRSFGLR